MAEDGPNYTNHNRGSLATALTLPLDVDDIFPSRHLIDLAHYQASTSAFKENCSCIVCLSVGSSEAEKYSCRFQACSHVEESVEKRTIHESLTHQCVEKWRLTKLPCRASDCDVVLAVYFDEGAKMRVSHERGHYLAQHTGITHNHSEKDYYLCPVKDCDYRSLRWSDLTRHITAKHCIAPKRFPCPAIGCKYSGENGFARKDKLKSHYQSMHAGKALPGQSLQAIRPAFMPKAQPSGYCNLAPK